MIYVFYALHIIVCLFLILVVLLQQGKGADLSVFGGGSTQTAFGARGAATLLHKLTVASFVIFIITTMGIAILKGGGSSASSVMSDVKPATSEAPATAEGEAVPAEAPDAATTPPASEAPDADAMDAGAMDAEPAGGNPPASDSPDGGR